MIHCIWEVFVSTQSTLLRLGLTTLSGYNVFEVRGQGARERANRGHARSVNAKSGGAFYARDRAREDDRAAIIQER